MDVKTRPVRMRAQMWDGTEPEVDAYPTPVPGLYVCADPQVPGTWSVTLLSGIAAAAGFTSPEAALGCAIDLGTVADWTRPIAKSEIDDQVVAIVTRWGAADGPTISEEMARAAGVIV